MYENKLIDLYSDGLTLESIATELSCSVPEVLAKLIEYREENRTHIKGKTYEYSSEFKDVITDRFIRNVSYTTIADDFQLNRTKLRSLIDESGFVVDTRAVQEEEPIDWDDFTTCPECKCSDKVAPVGENYFYKSYKAANCTNCQVEWYRVKGGTKLVRYTNLD